MKIAIRTFTTVLGATLSGAALPLTALLAAATAQAAAPAMHRLEVTPSTVAYGTTGQTRLTCCGSPPATSSMLTPC